MKNISLADDIATTAKLLPQELSILLNTCSNFFVSSRISQQSTEIILRRGNKSITLHIDKKNSLVSFDYKGRELKFKYNSTAELLDMIGMVKDEFLGMESARLNTRNRIVVDIGAYVGDTALYFAMNGASKVYAFEPYPYFYKLAAENVTINSMENKVKVINAACGTKRSSIKIDVAKSNFAGKTLKKTERGKRIETWSLDDIVRQFKLNNAAIKIDCEGCEYDIVLNASDETLHHFSHIEIEYHYGYLNLEDRLRKAGYKVEHTAPIKKYNFGSKSFMVLGFIYAKLH